MKNTKYISLLILLLAHLLTILDIFIVNVAIPSIQRGLDSSNGKIQLVVAMYMVGFASFLIIGGKIGDYFGRKKIFILGLFLFMVTSAGCGFAATTNQLIALRFFQGISASLMAPQVLSYIQILFVSHKERTYAMGWYGIAIGIGTMLGQFLGGSLVELQPFLIDQSWRYIFLINIPICLIAILLAMRYLNRSRDNSSLQMDYWSAFILCIGLALLVFSMAVGLEQKDLVAITLTISIVFLIGFILRQIKRKLKKKEPLLNMELFTHKNFNIAVSASALFMLMLDAYFFVLAIFLQDGIRLSPMQAGYFIVFQGCGFILASFFTARLVLQYGKNVLIFGVLLIMFSLIFQLVFFYYQSIDYKGYFAMFLHGIGVAMVLPSFANIALKDLPQNRIGNASGVYSTLQQLFGALGITLTGGVFYYFAKGKTDYTDFYNAFFYGTVIHLFCLTSVLLILFLLPNSVLPAKTEKEY
ncbi:MFS transporter [Flavobacterium sharifuzzamanii]|uniref:MFS transporter n=1 Tax=Flavobacterium sharifuzzamanii TaxID=2211133 RepID=UPI000DAE5C1F|nr:MFS transporter [Flavobacterium sharifuzzamanii]KAF2082211.1 MFS transporter [Flavobacterium sharifuzzamanii]